MMRMLKLLSLQATGESIEKAIAIHSTSLLSNYNFYSQYRTVIFYGHNLPKKSKTINVHGTIGFYCEYLSDLSFIPDCSHQYLISYKKQILEKLCIRGYISERNSKSLDNNIIMYLNFIKKLPFEFLYPEFYSKLIPNSAKLLNVYAFKQLYLEDNWPYLISRLDCNYARYSIYALETDGNVGKYYITGKILEDYRLVNSLTRKASLSGNSAILLKLIGYRIGGHTIVGYRIHSHSIRPNRDHALQFLLEKFSSVIEPKNHFLSGILNNIPGTYCDEVKTNIAFAKIFCNFLTTNRISLKL